MRTLIPDALSIFILPPSKDELKKRLIERGQDTSDTISQRLAEAELEMSQAHSYDYVIVNDDFDTALSDIKTVIQAERLRTEVQLRANPAVKALL